MLFSQKNLIRMLGSISVLGITLGAVCAAQADPLTLYVATNGSYSRTRDQASNSLTPVNTIGRAVALSQPGDTIEVAPGTYVGSVIIAYGSSLLIHGKAGAARPVLKPTPGENYAIVKISGSDNITFSGFDVDGDGDGPNAVGILINPRTTGSVITPSHHITIAGNLVHGAGGAGVATNPNEPTRTVGCDYITITGNEIYNNLSTGSVRGSAISLLKDQKYDSAAGYHSVIQKNNIHDNVNNNRDLDSNGNVDLYKHTDGNGIIIDTTDRSGPKVLIQNNLVYRNGGRGIHVFLSSNVDVLNNTVYGNDLDPYLQVQGGGELTVVTATDVLFSNNVVQGNGLAPAFLASIIRGNDALYYNSNVRFKNNTYTGTYSTNNNSATAKAETAKALDWTTTIYSDPSWGNLFMSPETGDFRLNLLATRSGLTSQQSQSARNRGSNTPGEFSWSDFTGVSRLGATPPGGYVDRGAYEQ